MAIGQLFSQRFGYAVHALCYAAKKPRGALTTVPELAEWMRTIWPSCSSTYLSNVIQQLARAGVLRSQRGVSGGYALARSAGDISLRDLAELLEGVDLGRCSLSLDRECPMERNCSIKRKLERLEASFLQSLQHVTIADMAKDLVVRPRRAASR